MLTIRCILSLIFKTSFHQVHFAKFVRKRTVQRKNGSTITKHFIELNMFHFVENVAKHSSPWMALLSTGWNFTQQQTTKCSRAGSVVQSIQQLISYGFTRDHILQINHFVVWFVTNRINIKRMLTAMFVTLK